MRAKEVLSHESSQNIHLHAQSSAPEVPNRHLHSPATLKPFAAPASDLDLGGLKKPISVRLVWMLEVYLQKGRQVVTPGAAALQACYLKSLELDENYAMAWSNLGNQGGGTVKGQAYDEKDRRGA